MALAKKMNPKKKTKEDLRRRAKRLLSKKTKSIPEIPAGDMKKLIQELQVHQVELEIQNEELRRAQAEIEESRSKYVDLYDFAPIGYFTLTQTGRIAEVNLTGAGLLGIERSQLIGRLFFVFVAPEFRSVFRHHCSEVLKKEERERCEIKLMKKDGTSFYAQLESIGVDGNKKNSTWIRSAVIDITERKRAEKDLNRQTKELETLAANAPDLIFRVNRNLRFVFVNQKITDLTGIPKKKFYGKTLLELGLPRDISIYLGKETQEVIDGHALNEFEFSFSGPEGRQWFHTRIVPEFDIHGDIETALGIAHDITDLKRAELAYREERAFRDSIERSLRIGIAAFDLEGRQSYVNSSFCEMVGWSKEELEGAKPPFVYWPPEEIKEINQAFQQVIRGKGFSHGLEFRLRRRNEERFDALILPSSLKDSQGKVIGWIGSVGDITEHKKRNEEIRRLNRELEQRVIERTTELEAANKELEAFTYSVSHDLKAPLIVASGFCRRLLELYGAKLDDKGSHYLQRIEESCSRMNLLINDLFNLSRVTTSKLNIHLIDLSDLAKSIAAQLKETQPAREASFIIEEGLSVKGDYGLIRIALENLLDNAWKFTSGGKEAKIEFGLTKSIEPTYFVRDNGSGFDMSRADRLFIPFQRLHTEDEFSGTGVGLATVHRIITRHGGRIWAESEGGKGATFFFTLPS